MKHSVFRRITLFILIAVLIAELATISMAFKIIYDSNFERTLNNIKNHSHTLVELGRYYDYENPDSTSYLSYTLEGYCREANLAYAYIEEIDLDQGTESYLAVGFGEHTTDEAHQQRYPGVTIKSKIYEEKLAALNGDTEHAVRHEVNRYGDTLIYYAAINELLDNESSRLVPTTRNLLVGVEVNISDVMLSFVRSFISVAVLTLILAILIVIIFSLILNHNAAKPARTINDRMSSFVEDYSKGFKPLQIKGKGEFAEMSRSFNTMAQNIDSYLTNITELNREQNKRQAELDIAGNIQQGLLSPPHCDGKGFTIDARTLVAKEVSGDLYDYLVLDDGRVFLTVADVSGKGISAALFMSRAVTLLHMYAQLGYSPAKILTEYNKTLAAQNPNLLFITTFVAIYDPNKHILTYSNAGHNIPYILSDTLIPLEAAHGMAAGVFDDESYEEATAAFREGDCLFLYTDGVNEAGNADDKLFGTKALEDILRGCLSADSGEVMKQVLTRLKSFVGSAARTDDITILVFRTKPLCFHRELNLPAVPESLNKINNALDAIPDLSEETRMSLDLICEEIFINICSYAYEDGGEVQVMIDVDDEAVLTFTDSGKPFDPTREVIQLEDYDHDQAIGGLGRYLTFRLADSYHYEYRDSKNILTIHKSLAPSGAQ